jgi:hypothetical protein
VPTPTKADHQFGEIAVRNKLLTRKQVDECLKALEEGDIRAKTLAEAVEQKGLLSARAVASIARAQNYREVRLESKLYARIALKNRFATMEEVRRALEEQKKAYLKGEPPPDFGELLLPKSKMGKEHDRAVREALRKLDKEQYVGRRKKDAGTELESSADEEIPAATTAGTRPPPRGGKRAAPRPSGKATKIPPIPTVGKQAPARPVKPAAAPPADDDDDVEPDEELDLALDSKDDIETSERAALGASAAPPEAPEPPPATSSSASSSSFSEGSVPEVAPARPEEPALRKRDDETNDNMDAILAPDDLSDLAQLGVQVSPRTIGGAKPALGGLPARFSGEGPAATPGAPALEPIDELKDLDIDLPPEAPAAGEPAAPPPAKAGGTGKLRVEAAGGGRECPRCNVSIEAGTNACIYCGYALGEAAPAAAAAEAPAGPAAQVELAPGVAEKPFESAFCDAKTLARGCRGELLRATARSDGGPRLIVRLPASLAPTPEQVSAFIDESAKVAALGLRHILALEEFAHDARGFYAVYEDAPGAAATVKAAEAPLDRMRAAKAVKEVASALAETAGAGFFARELRPDMVILPEEDGPPRIAGFAIARVFEPPATGAPAEPDAYVPPERVKKADRADARTEIFGVGALLKLLLTGSGPTGKEPKELPNVPGGLRTILVKTLDPVTGKRYVDHGRLLEDIDKTPGAKGHEVALRR